MSALAQRYWALPYHPARAFWLGRGMCLLLALDALLLMVEHAGRYGVNGFNVAHFAWLDALAPLGSPAPYLALLTSSALLALCGAFRPLPRPLQALLCATYTGAWALSQHDSYQHHYLLSWLLAWLLWLPRPRLVEARDPTARCDGAGLPLIALTCAIVYAFTAVSKSSVAWQSGAVLRQLARSPGPFSLLTALDAWLGSNGAAFRIAAAAVLALQIVVALAYVLVPLRDARAERGARSARTLSAFCTLGWLAAIAFHLTTELQASFSIGWFSYYMLWIGAALLAPDAWLAAGCAGLSQLGARVRTPRPRPALAEGVAVLFGLWLIRTADLPGLAWAIGGVGLILLSLSLWRQQQGRPDSAGDLALSFALSLALTAACLSLGHVRFHYYRRLAGELLRMERLDEALHNYRKAQQYAPRGQTRGAVIQRIERRLSEQRGERHRQL